MLSSGRLQKPPVTVPEAPTFRGGMGVEPKIGEGNHSGSEKLWSVLYGRWRETATLLP